MMLTLIIYADKAWQSLKANPYSQAVCLLTYKPFDLLSLHNVGIINNVNDFALAI